MKLFHLVLSVLLLLNLAGCGSKRELDQLAFIFGLYIDVGEEPGTVEVSISSPLPNRQQSSTQQGSGVGKTYSMVSKTASSITDALSLIEKDLTRTLEISHIKVVVLGKNYARKGITEALDWFERQPEIPMGTYIMTAPGKAKEITRLTTTFEQLPDQVLMNFSKKNFLFATTLRDCLLADSSNMGYAMNYLSFSQKSDLANEGKTVHWAGNKGVALFQKGKLRSTLPIKESRALAWAAGKMAGHLTLPEYTIQWDEGGTGEASALFLSNKSSTNVKFTDNGPVFYVKLKGKASINNFKDSQGRKATALSSVIVQKLQEVVAKEASDALHASQEAGADVLRLGMLVEWNDPVEWKKLREHWEDYYKQEAQIKVSAAFQIQDFGVLK